MDAARRALADVVLADPVFRAFIDYAVASGRRYEASAEAQAAAQALDRPGVQPEPVGVDPAEVSTAVAEVLRREVANRLEDEREARQVALDQYMVGGSE